MRTGISLLRTPSLASFLLGALTFTTAHAQSAEPLPSRESGPEIFTVDTAAPDQSPAGQAAASSAATPNVGWHLDATMYLWGAGLHGNIVTADNSVGYKASFSDLLKHRDIGA